MVKQHYGSPSLLERAAPSLSAWLDTQECQHSRAHLPVLLLVADFCFVDGPSTHPFTSSHFQSTQARVVFGGSPFQTTAKPDACHTIPFHLLPPNRSPVQHNRAYSTCSVQKTHHNQRSSRQYSQHTNDPNTNRKPSTNTANSLTHLDATGAAHMVDISHKKETTRLATATATLLFSTPETHAALSSQTIAKGDAIAVARIAAIQAAKKTSDLIPLAHPSLNITGINVEIESFSSDEQRFTHTMSRRGQSVSTLESGCGGVTVRATVKCQGKTGVEMEAITAATMGAVTLYDMLKAIDKGMVVVGARVVEKRGGKSGDWVWDECANRLVRPEGVAGKLDGQETVGGIKVQERTPALSDVEQWNAGLPWELSRQESLGGNDHKLQEEQSALSDVEQWNEGLAAEFSIMDEVEALEKERKN